MVGTEEAKHINVHKLQTHALKPSSWNTQGAFDFIQLSSPFAAAGLQRPEWAVDEVRLSSLPMWPLVPSIIQADCESDTKEQCRSIFWAGEAGGQLYCIV
jgi:hypothetical protein